MVPSENNIYQVCIICQAVNIIYYIYHMDLFALYISVRLLLILSYFFIWGNWGSEELVCCLKSYKGDHTGIWCGKYRFGPASHCRHEPLRNKQQPQSRPASDGCSGAALQHSSARTHLWRGCRVLNPWTHCLEEERGKWLAALVIIALPEVKIRNGSSTKREWATQRRERKCLLRGQPLS